MSSYIDAEAYARGTMVKTVRGTTLLRIEDMEAKPIWLIVDSPTRKAMVVFNDTKFYSTLDKVLGVIGKEK